MPTLYNVVFILFNFLVPFAMFLMLSKVLFSSPSSSSSSLSNSSWWKNLFRSVCLPRFSCVTNVSDSSSQTFHPTKGSESGWRILFQCFDPQVFFWRFVILLRQFILIVLSISFFQESSSRYIAFTYFNLLIFIFHIAVRPFRSHRSNFYEILADFSLLLIIIPTISDQPPFKGEQKQYVQSVILIMIIVLVLNVLLVRFFNLQTIKSYWKTNERNTHWGIAIGRFFFDDPIADPKSKTKADRNNSGVEMMVGKSENDGEIAISETREIH